VAKNWFSRLNPLASRADAKALQEENNELSRSLDAVVGEFRDSMQYEAKFFDAEGANYSGGGFTELSGIDQIVNATSLAKIYTSETWVYVAVSAIAQTVAGFPIRLEKSHAVTQQIRNEATGNEESVSQQVWVEASGDPLAKRFKQPNPYCTRTEFITMLLIDLLTAGEYFVYLDSDVDLTQADEAAAEDPSSPFGRIRQQMSSQSMVKAMYRIPPALMKAVQDDENPFKIAGYQMQSDHGSYVFGAAEMIHVKLPNPLNQHVGLSPLIPAFKPVLIDRFSTEHMIRFYKSGARLGGVIQTDKSLNREQLSRFQRSFENNYTGRQNHHRTLILPPGMKYEPIEQNPAQAALLDFCKYNREAVLAAYRVPPIKAGLTDGQNYANSRSQLRTFYKDTVIPLLAFVQDGFNLKPALMPVDIYRMKFDLTDVEELHDDGVALGQVAKGMLDSGATVNEVRKKVWKLAPIADGDQSPVIAKIERDMVNSVIANGGTDPTAEPGASDAAPADQSTGAESAVEANQEEIAQNQVTDPTLSLNGSQVQALLSIIQQVSQGLLPRASGIEIIIASFSVPRESAERIMGTVGESFVPNPAIDPNSVINLDAPKAEEIKDAPTGPGSDIVSTKVTFSERVNQLVAQYVQEGIPLEQAIPKAIAQARAEGFSPDDEDPTDPDGTPPAPTSDGSGPPDQSTPPPAAEGAKAEMPVADVRAQAQVETPRYGAGFTKEQAAAQWKSFVEKTDPLIYKRALNVRSFFEKFKSVIMKRLGANVKAYGIMKARDSEDIDEILDKGGELEALAKQYGAEVDKVLEDAVRLGYGETLVDLKLAGPEDAAVVERVRKLLGDKIGGITDKTLEQLRTLLADKFEAGTAIGEVSKAIQEKFAEIESGRAVTIARTETLTAASIGQKMARETAKREFPEKRFKKTWVSALLDTTRESHERLDGVTVDADEAYPNGLMFPRDPDGEAEEVVNCVCTEITHMEETMDLVRENLAE
jgi:HK97 family phage portal protein